MPNLPFSYLGYYFFFFASEMSGKSLEPVHIHFSKGHSRTKLSKVWVGENDVSVAFHSPDVSDREMRKLLRFIKDNRGIIIAYWNDFFKDIIEKS
ncbi:MAG: DUF4160 domain-containing protein [Oscillospiraceae bacterium]|nr:DUF4160 domain-containing protein [Oscillospiraceae bacterium]